jgi:protein SCO1/2
MVYTSCTTACPVTVADIQRMEMELGAQKDDLRVLLISMDPTRDTPEKLKELADRHKVDPERWRLIRTDDVRLIHRISQTLGIEIYPEANGEFSHSAVYTLLDPDGNNDSRVSGLGADVSELVKRVGEMVSP